MELVKFQEATEVENKKNKLPRPAFFANFKERKLIFIILSILIFVFIFLTSGYTPVSLVLDTSVRTTLNLVFFVINLTIFVLLGNFKRLASEVKARQIPASYIVLFVIGFSTILTMVANRDIGSFIAYAGHGLVIVNGFLISRFFPMRAFIKTFCNLVFGLTVIGLIFYLFYIVGGVNISPLPSLYNSHGTEFGNFFFLAYQIMGSNRFSGFAWEPGLMASFLIEALILELIFEKNTNKLHFVVFSGALILTFSTFAYLVYLLVILVALKKWIKKRNLFIGVCISFAVIVLLCVVFYEQVISFLALLMPSVFRKMLPSATNGSLFTRIYSPYVDFLIFLKSPIWGVGLSDFYQMYTEIFSSGQFPHADGSQTSTTFSLMGQFGIFGLVTIVALSIAIGKNKNISVFNRVLLILTFFLILNKEPHNNFLIDSCFLFVFLRDVEKNKERSLLFEEPSECCLLTSMRNKTMKAKQGDLIEESIENKGTNAKKEKN